MMRTVISSTGIFIPQRPWGVSGGAKRDRRASPLSRRMITGGAIRCVEQPLAAALYAASAANRQDERSPRSFCHHRRRLHRGRGGPATPTFGTTEDAVIPIPLISAAAGPARRADDQADHLRRDAARMLPPGGPADRHGHRRDREPSACFPNTLVRFCGQRFLHGRDKDLALLCVKAYNDFQIEESAGSSDGRLRFLSGSSPSGMPSLQQRRWTAWLRRVCPLCASLSCLLASTCHRSTRTTGTRSLQPASETAWGSSCTSGRARRSEVLLGLSARRHFSALMAVNCTIALVDWLFSAKLIQFPELKLTSPKRSGLDPVLPPALVDEVWEDRRAWGGIHPLLTDPAQPSGPWSRLVLHVR